MDSPPDNLCAGFFLENSETGRKGGEISMDQTLTLAIIGHLVGDYLVQNDWMAQNKKKNSFICAIHCLFWTGSVMALTGWYAIMSARVLLVFGVLFLTHFAQDRTNIVQWWMKLIRQPKFLQPPLAPWSIIVVDNVWHIVAIWAVWKFIA